MHEVVWHSDEMDYLSETPSGSRQRAASTHSNRSGASRHSSRSGGTKASSVSKTSAHVPIDPATPQKMESENVSTKRSEPEAPVIDITFDSPENLKEGKLPKSEADTVKPLPYPLDSGFGSGIQQSSSSSSGAALQPSPPLPAFRSQSGVM